MLWTWILIMQLLKDIYNNNFTHEYVVVVFCNLSQYHAKVYTKWQFLQPISHIATAREFGLILYTCGNLLIVLEWRHWINELDIVRKMFC